ncbi:MAG: sugar ABC transporter permease, partial [Clostridia bacterium]
MIAQPSAGKMPASRDIHRRPLRQRLWRNRYIYLMLLPVVAYFLIFKYLPMLWLRISFYDYKLIRGFAGSKFVGLKHYIKFFSGMDFWMLIRNTLALNFSVLLFVFPTPIVFSLLLNELRQLRYKKLVQTISYLPYFISITVLVSMITTFLSPTVGTLSMV